MEAFPQSHDESGGGDVDRARRTTGYLFGVADGIGGAPAGERASSLVAGTLEDFVKEESAGLLRAGRPDGEIMETLRRGVSRCQAALAEDVRDHPERSGMGTTLTAAVVLWPKLFLFHMGDSRAYLLRESSLRRLTRDQTYARSLVEAGILDSRNENLSRWKHVVRNVLRAKASGEIPEVHPEVRIETLRGHDILVLCTDGLTHSVADERIQAFLLNGGSSEDLCDGLIDLARAMRAQDDVTVLVARFADPNGGMIR